MDDRTMARNKENRTFLHDIASQIAILGLVLRRLSDPKNQQTGVNEGHNAELLVRAKEAIKKLETMHANFKAELSVREGQDSGEIKPKVA